MLKTEFFRGWGDWSCINHPVPNCNFTNELHPQLMEGTSLHQAAGQFKSLTWNMLIAVNLGTCCSCSTLFLLNCFSLDCLLDLSIPAPFPRSPVKGTYGSRSLNFDQQDRTRYNCRTPFILPSQQLNLTDFLPYFAICFFFFLWTSPILSFSAETRPFLSLFLSCIFTPLCQWDSEPKLSVSLRQNNLFTECT